ncbi:MAG TPA: alpha/beta hydrolase, partial [Candidatus Eisenbacteria bacterium]|nr:alpha/beta hydrolase [Candidatus Eisenbacteria bacterium]
LSDDEYRIGPRLAESLVLDGVGVALVRYRLAPGVSYRSQADDVAAAIGFLVREGRRYGYDEGRVFLSGHSAGGHLAALVALDPTYLAKYKLTSKVLAGVIPISGLYDLAPTTVVSEQQKAATEKAFGTNSDILKRASPVTHARRDAPPFLILNAQSDFTGFLLDAKRFSDALSRTGHRAVERWIVPERDHFTVMDLGDRDNEARLLLLEFLKVAPLPPEFAILVAAKRRWRSPPFSTLPFWDHAELVRSRPVDRRFVLRMAAVYSTVRYELQEWPLETYHAIDLFALLDKLPAEKVGKGEYVVTTNIRGERQFWKRGQLEPYKPVVVIGLDDERNLFRLGVFYRANREYSWKAGPQPPMMARPLGAFIHFLEEPPAELGVQAAQYALTIDSFRLVERDPLAGLADLSRDLRETMSFRNGCVYCHDFRGIGSRSHHVTAANGKPHGGFALPLASYPPEVWRNFVFDQESVAKKIGASPNIVAPEVRQALFELVNGSRASQRRE